MCTPFFAGASMEILRFVVRHIYIKPLSHPHNTMQNKITMLTKIIQDYFAKAWKEYEDGFGNPDAEFWLGLTKMSELTATGQWELEVKLTDYEGQAYTALYSDFSVGDSSTNYKLRVSGYNVSQSTLPDSLTTTGSSESYLKKNSYQTKNSYLNHKDMAFSTTDRDNDMAGGSCANAYRGGGGWWFNYCGLTSLTGTNLNDKTKDEQWHLLECLSSNSPCVKVCFLARSRDENQKEISKSDSHLLLFFGLNLLESSILYISQLHDEYCCDIFYCESWITMCLTPIKHRKSNKLQYLVH